MFMIHGVHDNAARITAAEWFFGNRFDRDHDKVWIGQWDHGSTNGRCGDEDGARALHPTCRFDQMKYAIHAWFDKHLMGSDVDTGPAVKAFLNGEQTQSLTEVRDPLAPPRGPAARVAAGPVSRTVGLARKDGSSSATCCSRSRADAEP